MIKRGGPKNIKQNARAVVGLGEREVRVKAMATVVVVPQVAAAVEIGEYSTTVVCATLSSYQINSDKFFQKKSFM